MKDEGHTDYVLFVHRFAARARSARWIASIPPGRPRIPTASATATSPLCAASTPALGLAVKSAALAEVAGTLVEVYLGRDAGRRVLEGRIQRGVADRIEAALWFSDLRSFTTITDTASPSEIIPLLNDYAEAVITAIHEAGGDVLKLIGDGTLALFRADDPSDACRARARGRSRSCAAA